MHLTGQERILRDVRPTRVLVKGKKEEPYNPDDDAEEGQEVW